MTEAGRQVQSAHRARDIAEHPARRRERLWPARVEMLLPVLIVLTLLGLATLRHQQTLAIGAALARGETPPVPDVTLPRVGWATGVVAAIPGTSDRAQLLGFLVHSMPR